jgi:rhodanese-related sulfurtransferase
MAVKRVSPEDARDLVDKDGYVYVDVRSVQEFQAGHPTGAYNVPLLHMGPAGMTANEDFLGVMEKAFPKDAKIVVGCKAGGRSLKAATVLESAGFSNVIDQRAGFEGTVDASGRPEKGWRPSGLPVSTAPAPDHTYEALRGKAR